MDAGGNENETKTDTQSDPIGAFCSVGVHEKVTKSDRTADMQPSEAASMAGLR